MKHCERSRNGLREWKMNYYTFYKIKCTVFVLFLFNLVFALFADMLEFGIFRCELLFLENANVRPT